jgi:hypothetical protein
MKSGLSAEHVHTEEAAFGRASARATPAGERASASSTSPGSP